MLHLSCISSNGVVLSCDAERVTVGTQPGNITILSGHMPLVSIVEASVVTIVDPQNLANEFFPFVKNSRLYLSVGKGLIYVHKDNIRLVVSYASYRPHTGKDKLFEKKRFLEGQLVALRAQADIEDINSHLDEIKKIKAEIQLYDYLSE